MVSQDDVSAVVRRCHALLGDPVDWTSPTGYPESLALCVIDAIWSIGIRYKNVDGVITRYRGSGKNADSHDLTDLLAAVQEAGGTDAWRSRVGTKHRTSSRGGIYKSDAVVQAAQALVTLGLDSAADLRTATGSQLSDGERAWRAVRGQRSGISWHYLQLLTGAEDVKPDRMIRNFLKGALPSLPDPETARALVLAVAQEMNVSPRTLDHRIWRCQSGRT